MAGPGKSERPKAVDGQRSVTGDLAARIAKAQAEQPPEPPAEGTGQAGMSGAGRAYRLASEFIAAIVVGGALGYGIDWVFKTQPWGLVILILLGFGAGVLNMVRATAEMNAINAVPPGTPAVRDDDDE